MVNCPECGKPLSKPTTKSRYQCQSEDCPVIYVRYPHIPALRAIVYESSKKGN
jgi:hypothetical protein